MPAGKVRLSMIQVLIAGFAFVFAPVPDDPAA